MAEVRCSTEQQRKNDERKEKWEIISIVCIEREPQCAKMAFIIWMLFPPLSASAIVGRVSIGTGLRCAQ